MQRHRPLSALALIGVLVGALSLAACGRKSGLDLPPSASTAPAAEETRSVMSPMAKPPKTEPRVVPDKRLPIDVLLE